MRFRQEATISIRSDRLKDRPSTGRGETTAPLGPAQPARMTPRAQTTALASLTTPNVAKAIRSAAAIFIVVAPSVWKACNHLGVSRDVSFDFDHIEGFANGFDRRAMTAANGCSPF
jgi:hypothetical protein